MKFRWDKKYLYWGLTAFLVLTAIVAVVYLLFNGFSFKSNIDYVVSVFMPIIDGFVLAYLIAPIVNTFERKLIYPLLEKKKVTITKRLFAQIRILSMFVSYVSVSVALYSFFQFVVPQVYNSILSIIGQFPTYVNNIIRALDEFFHHNPEMEEYASEIISYFSTINQGLLSNINGLLRTFSHSILSVFRKFLNLTIGIVVSTYLIYSKEKFIAQAKKLIYAIFERSTANSLITDFRMIHRTFIGFIGGKIIDSIIIGILCYICINFIGTPYPLLISVIVGVTNVIPYFGPFIGAIPSALLVLMVDPMECLYFVIFIFLLQQFDGNILGPKILGDSIGVSAFWIIFSVTVFGGLLGVVGMVIGVPLFAVIYNLINRRIRKSLEKRGYPVDTEDYKYMTKIDDHNQIIKENDLTIR